MRSGGETINEKRILNFSGEKILNFRDFINSNPKKHSRASDLFQPKEENVLPNIRCLVAEIHKISPNSNSPRIIMVLLTSENKIRGFFLILRFAKNMVTRFG